VDIRTEHESQQQLDALEARLEAIACREDYGQWIHCFGDGTTPATVEQQALLAEVRQLIELRSSIYHTR